MQKGFDNLQAKAQENELEKQIKQNSLKQMLKIKEKELSNSNAQKNSRMKMKNYEKN